MKTKPTLASLLLVTLSLPCAADTFTLKDGTKLEGKILKEEGDSYVLEVQVTKSIKDERVVVKADVVKVDREQPDLKAYEPIAGLVPTPDLLTEDEYLAKINQVNKFLKDHPTSSKAKDAKAVLATLKTEAGKLTNGGVKMKGNFISPEDYKANAYDLDARVMETKIRTLVAENKLVQALRLYSTFDKDYRTTLSYGALSPLIKQVIQAYVDDAKQQSLTLEARLAERKAGLDRMSPEDRAATAEAIAEEDAAIAAAFKAEKEAKVGWVSPSPSNKDALTEAARFGQSEINRLSGVKTVLGVDGGKAYAEAYKAVHGGSNAAATTAAISAAKTALVPARYLAPLEEQAKGRK